MKRILAQLSMVALLGGCLLSLAACAGLAKESAPPPSAPPGRQETGYFRTEVFFATDRSREAGPRLRFTGRRGSDKLVYGVVYVSIPDTHEIGRIESPGWWKF